MYQKLKLLHSFTLNWESMKEAMTTQKRCIGEHNINIVSIVNYVAYIYYIFF